MTEANQGGPLPSKPTAPTAPKTELGSSAKNAVPPGDSVPGWDTGRPGHHVVHSVVDGWDRSR